VDSEATTSDIPVLIPARTRSGPISLPVSVFQSRSAAAIRVASRPQALIIDDCRFIAGRVARALEAKGFECTVVGDGFAGLDLVRARRFDLFVLDVDVPFVGGFAVLRQLRGSTVHANTPVLMLAAERSEVDEVRALALGASGYMAKPLQLRPLNAMVDSLL